MQFEFSEEQRELKDSVRRLFEKECPTSIVRSAIDSPHGHDPSLWRLMGTNGYLAAAIPEEHGGAGAGYLELCVVAEECGRALAPIPTVSSIYQAVELLMMAGSIEQKAAWLPKLAACEAVGTVAVAEKAGFTGPGSIQSRVTNGKLTGIKAAVLDGMEADFAIVLARDTSDAPTLVLANLRGHDVLRVPASTIDPSRKHARILFNEAPVELLGAPGQGWALLEQMRDRAAVLVAFEQLGGADAALSMARNYALERFAFGRQIGGFQAVKHLLADMYVAVELARSNAYFGAWALSTGSVELTQAASCARVAATQAFQLCAADNIQVHGGMGFTWDSDCHLYYRRSNYLALTLGALPLWESRLVESLRTARAA